MGGFLSRGLLIKEHAKRYLIDIFIINSIKGLTKVQKSNYFVVEGEPKLGFSSPSCQAFGGRCRPLEVFPPEVSWFFLFSLPK
jgi:hypothetical protein